MLQVAPPIAEELLARNVNQGQALLERASLVGDLTDYEAWKADRKQWTGQTAEALGQIYDTPDEAEEFADAASGSAGAKRWQQQYAADVACVERGLELLGKHLQELDPTWLPHERKDVAGSGSASESESESEAERAPEPQPSEEINPFERPQSDFERDLGGAAPPAEPVKPMKEPDPALEPFERSGPYGPGQVEEPQRVAELDPPSAVGSELTPAEASSNAEVVAQSGSEAVAIPDRMRRVFLAHGRDERWMQAVGQLLERTGPHSVTVLNERPTDRRMLSEQFEGQVEGAHYAVVLLTADDVGAPRLQSDDEPYYSPRARQGVVFEMGFLVAALTSGCVCVLYEDGVELPCDLDGIAYVRLDFAGTWQSKLLLQLRKAGFNYDMNRLAPV
jgi:predicted nucleotide-binding protein